jgi:2-hydroxychromene-2-carboxylate isomerase
MIVASSRAVGALAGLQRRDGGSPLAHGSHPVQPQPATDVAECAGQEAAMSNGQQGGAIDFWFTLGSTYTYLAAMRLDEVARTHGVGFRWRPFNLRTILAEMKHVPFADKPAKSRYMWRDIERRARLYGLAPTLPALYPLADTALPNKVALVGMDEGWGRDFVDAHYRCWMHQGKDPSLEPALAGNLRAAGQEPARVLAAAHGAAMEQRLAAETSTAAALGIFGSPTFVVDGEIFWGDDRIEDAMAWRRHGRLGAAAT